MRTILSLLVLVALLGISLPAQAQLRSEVPQRQQAPVKLYDQGGPAFSLNQLFSPQHFQMNHSYEMSFGSYGGASSSLGMYTNTMMWQFNQKLAARVDVSVAHSFMGNQLGPDGEKARVFLRNAEIAYRPTENMRLHFSVRQSPYGSYAGPYGYYGGPFRSSYGFQPHDLFWNDGPR